MASVPCVRLRAFLPDGSPCHGEFWHEPTVQALESSARRSEPDASSRAAMGGHDPERSHLRSSTHCAATRSLAIGVPATTHRHNLWPKWATRSN